MARPTSFFGLPQELEDMIFDFAYHPVPVLSLIIRAEWHARWQDAIRDELASTTYGTGSRPWTIQARVLWSRSRLPPVFDRKVDEWLVSKPFFIRAAST